MDLLRMIKWIAVHFLFLVLKWIHFVISGPQAISLEVFSVKNGYLSSSTPRLITFSIFFKGKWQHEPGDRKKKDKLTSREKRCPFYDSFYSTGKEFVF